MSEQKYILTFTCKKQQKIEFLVLFEVDIRSSNAWKQNGVTVVFWWVCWWQVHLVP